MVDKITPIPHYPLKTGGQRATGVHQEAGPTKYA